MKAGRVLRGRLADNEERRLIVDDGNPNDGWRITRFVVAGDSVNNDEVAAKVAFKRTNTGFWRWDNNLEIAWAASRQTAQATWGGFDGAIDPSAVIVRDCWIRGASANGNDINFLIEIERVSLSDDQAILALIQERAQDDL
jgi:hypothetical protein